LLELKTWLGPESNRRHETQPTKIPFSLVELTLKTSSTL
jgi:hypothetical protein